MKRVDLDAIRRHFDDVEAIEEMRAALVAQARGECDTPMPMHLGIAEERAEVHVKSSYRRGGDYFAVKVAGGFPRNPERGLPVGDGLIALFSAATGEPLALLLDRGFLTDARTAAVAALMARELGRRDRTLGILGTGVQARLQARFHAAVLDLEEIRVWGRDPERVAACLEDLGRIVPRARLGAAGSPAELAGWTRLLVTVTASRRPLVAAGDVAPGTHVSAVGSDTPGKQELEPALLERAELLLVDSRAQCERLGELQHAPALAARAVEAGAWLESPRKPAADAVTVCDFTGLGVEDLFVARYVYEKLADESGASPPRREAE